MVATFPKIDNPEVFIGFVAPIGTDVQACVDDFTKFFTAFNYRVVPIKVTDIFDTLSRVVPPKKSLKQTPLYDRYVSHIAYGNQLRKHFKDDAVLASMAIARTVRRRIKLGPTSDNQRYAKTAYLLYQFKRKEEIDLLRSVYGRLFFQVSVYSRRGVRQDFLSRKFAYSENSADIGKYISSAESLIQIDENEQDEDHGQRISKIFHDGDFIINTDVQSPSREAQIERFCNLCLDLIKYPRIKLNMECSRLRQLH